MPVVAADEVREEELADSDGLFFKLGIMNGDRHIEGFCCNNGKKENGSELTGSYGCRI
jgi:hypothetical protein